MFVSILSMDSYTPGGVQFLRSSKQNNFQKFLNFFTNQNTFLKLISEEIIEIFTFFRIQNKKFRLLKILTNIMMVRIAAQDAFSP